MTGSGGFGGYAPFKFGTIRPEPLREFVPGSRELIDQVLQGLSPGRVIEGYLESRLTLGHARVDAKATEMLRRVPLQAKNRGDFNSAVLSGGFYAKKLGHTMYLYSGNSFGHLIWRVSDKASEYLDPINNTGTKVVSVSPDLEVAYHDLDRGLGEASLGGGLGTPITDNTKELYLSTAQPDIDALYHAVEMAARDLPAVQFKAVEPGEMAGERKVWVRSEEMGDLQTLIHELREKGVSFTVGEVRREQRP